MDSLFTRDIILRIIAILYFFTGLRNGVDAAVNCADDISRFHDVSTVFSNSTHHDPPPSPVMTASHPVTKRQTPVFEVYPPTVSVHVPTPLIPEPSNMYNWRNAPILHPVSTPFPAFPDRWGIFLPRVQEDFKIIPDEPVREHDFQIRTHIERRAAVRVRFLENWNWYKEHAWGADEVDVITGQRNDRLGGWGAMIVENLDTLWIMGWEEEYDEEVQKLFDEACQEVAKMDFSPWKQCGSSLDMFETGVRFLGGFLSAYDLVRTGQYEQHRALFKNKAIEVGDMILTSFNTANGMPVLQWYAGKTANGIEQKPPTHGNLAQLASATLELTRLSQITGDMRYYNVAIRITNLMLQQQDQTKIPGLFPRDINICDADLSKGNTFNLGSGSNVAYEYIPKMHALLRGNESSYSELYSKFTNAAIEHLLFRPILPNPEDVLAAGVAHAGQPRENEIDYASCSAGSLFLLGGRLFKNDHHINIGTKLTKGCLAISSQFPNGIMPERFVVKECTPTYCEYHPYDFPNPEWLKRDFTTEIKDPRYLLRPEVVESLFYLYRVTGDQTLPDIAWNLFKTLNDLTRLPFDGGPLPNAPVSNVLDTPPSDPNGRIAKEFGPQPVHWTAETLKYFYLIFSRPEALSLDEYVFNTRGHPFRWRDMRYPGKPFVPTTRPLDKHASSWW